MDWEQRFTQALAPLDCPVFRPPAGADHETYLTFREVQGLYGTAASNRSRTLTHLIQVEVSSLREDGAHRTRFFEALALLRGIGVRVYAYGPDDFDKETQRHYIAATVEWAEKLEG